MTLESGEARRGLNADPPRRRVRTARQVYWSITHRCAWAPRSSRRRVLSRHTKSIVGDLRSHRSAGRGRMTTMAVIGITGSTDGIGRAAARVLLADGHRILVHARSRERGEPVAKAPRSGSWRPGAD
jgi:hypothetical protein